MKSITQIAKLLHKPNFYYGGYSGKTSKGTLSVQPLSVLNQNTTKCLFKKEKDTQTFTREMLYYF